MRKHKTGIVQIRIVKANLVGSYSVKIILQQFRIFKTCIPYNGACKNGKLDVRIFKIATFNFAKIEKTHSERYIFKIAIFKFCVRKTTADNFFLRKINTVKFQFGKIKTVDIFGAF